MKQTIEIGDWVHIKGEDPKAIGIVVYCKEHARTEIRWPNGRSKDLTSAIGLTKVL